MPYGIATVLMILWGRHSDRRAERTWHTAIPLLLAGFGLAVLNLAGGITLTIVAVSFALVGAYAFKGRSGPCRPAGSRPGRSRQGSPASTPSPT